MNGRTSWSWTSSLRKTVLGLSHSNNSSGFPVTPSTFQLTFVPSPPTLILCGNVKGNYTRTLTWNYSTSRFSSRPILRIPTPVNTFAYSVRRVPVFFLEIFLLCQHSRSHWWGGDWEHVGAFFGRDGGFEGDSGCQPAP